MNVAYRFAKNEDINGIVNLVREAFSERYVNMIIWGSDGIQKYIQGLLTCDSALCDISNSVAILEGKVVAVTQIKRNPLKKEIYLNYICTDAQERKQKLASNLLLFAGRNQPRKFETIALDVFYDNTVALAWYEGLGFKRGSSKVWTVFDLDICSAVTGVLSGLPQAKNCYSSFGFSQITLSTEKSEYGVGILGKNYFRVTDATILSDGEALTTLAKLDSNRKLLVIAKDFPFKQILHSFVNVTETISLTASLDAVLEKLEDQTKNY